MYRSIGQVPDYSQIVTNKMDLETVKSRHKNARYPHVEAFFGDLLLVYTNAETYYDRGGKHRNKCIYETAKVWVVRRLCSDPLAKLCGCWLVG